MTRRGFVEEAALGIAETVAGAPWLTAAVLLGSTWLFRDVRWCVGAASLAGLALARRTEWRRWAFVVALVSVASFAPQASGYAEAPWIDPGVPTPLLRASLLLLATAVGMRSPALALTGVAALVSSSWSMAEALIGSWRQSERVVTSVVWAAASLVLLFVGRRGWVRTGLGASLVFALAWRWIDRSFRLPTSTGETVLIALRWALESLLSICPLVAGLASRGASAAYAPGLTRLVVLAQRRPWLSIAAVGGFVVVLAGPSLPFIEYGWQRKSWFPTMGALSTGSLLLVCLASRSRDFLAWLALPVFASVGVLAVSEQSYWSSPRTVESNVRVIEIAVTVFWPIVVGAILLRADDRLRVPDAVLAAMVTVLLVLPSLVESRGLIDELQWVWIGVASVAFAAALRIRAGSAQIVAGACLLGASVYLALLISGGEPAIGERVNWPVQIGAIPLSAVYVVIARRARSMTAVPIDHPAAADFDGAARVPVQA